MDEQKRTKLLAAGLGAVVAVYFGQSAVSSWVMGPIRDLERKVASAESQAEKLADDEIQLNVAQRNLKDWKQISLPGDIDTAQRLYREWVFDLARQCGFSGSGFEVVRDRSQQAHLDILLGRGAEFDGLQALATGRETEQAVGPARKAGFSPTVSERALSSFCPMLRSLSCIESAQRNRPTLVE